MQCDALRCVALRYDALRCVEVKPSGSGFKTCRAFSNKRLATVSCRYFPHEIRSLFTHIVFIHHYLTRVRESLDPTSECLVSNKAFTCQFANAGPLYCLADGGPYIYKYIEFIYNYIVILRKSRNRDV